MSKNVERVTVSLDGVVLLGDKKDIQECRPGLMVVVNGRRTYYGRENIVEGPPGETIQEFLEDSN